jgi:hypothetical protein
MLLLFRDAFSAKLFRNLEVVNLSYAKKPLSTLSYFLAVILGKKKKEAAALNKEIGDDSSVLGVRIQPLANEKELLSKRMVCRKISYLWFVPLNNRSLFQVVKRKKDCCTNRSSDYLF